MPVCWQHLVKEKQRQSREPLPSLNSNAGGGATVREISFSMAKDFIVQYEWLGNIGATKYCYGLFIGDDLAAVTCYTTPPSPNAYRTLLGPEVATDVYQLCRGASASWAPKWSGSKVTAGSLRLLRQRRGARVVVAYADPRAGEVGVVYQAANAVYLGFTDSRGPGTYVILGVTFHARAVQKIFGSARHDHLYAIDPEYTRVQRSRKHRYVFLLDTGFRRRQLLERLRSLVRPYPKRLTSSSELPAIARSA